MSACVKTSFGVPRFRGSRIVRPADRVNAELQTEVVAAQLTSQTSSEAGERNARQHRHRRFLHQSDRLERLFRIWHRMLRDICFPKRA